CNYMARDKKNSQVEEPKYYETFDSVAYVFRSNEKNPSNEGVGVGQEDETSPPLRIELEMKLVTNKDFFIKLSVKYLHRNIYTCQKKELLDQLGDASSRKMELELEVQELELELKNWETTGESNKKMFENH
ncbi:hypothetical protein KI387_028689, partial [Taxus chinensis]